MFDARSLSSARDRSSWIVAVLVFIATPALAGNPVAVDDTVPSLGQRQAVDVLANDSEPDGLALDVSIPDAGSCLGTVQVIDSLVVHTPTPGDRSGCSLTYRVGADGDTGFATATLTFQETATIFADGFESENTSAWTGEVQ